MRRATAGVLGLAMAACGFEQRAHLTDGDLIANFARNRTALERIARMAEEDHQLHRVAQDFVSPDHRPPDPGKPQIAPDRWEEYRRLFREADVPDGFLKPAGGPEMLLLFSSTQGWVGGGTAKGYAYSRQDLKPLVESLDDPDRESHAQDTRAFVRLADGWYLFFEWS